jgi:hypothetical protein
VHEIDEPEALLAAIYAGQNVLMGNDSAVRINVLDINSELLDERLGDQLGAMARLRSALAAQEADPKMATSAAVDPLKPSSEERLLSNQPATRSSGRL